MILVLSISLLLLILYHRYIGLVDRDFCFVLFYLTFVFYAGPSVSIIGLEQQYVVRYFVAIIALPLFYLIFRRMFVSIGVLSVDALAGFYNQICAKRWFNFIFLVYAFLCMIPLVHPNFRLESIFLPPAPDLTKAFGARFDGSEKDFVIRMGETFKNLLYPFLLIGFFKFRKRIYLILLYQFFIFYLEYLDSEYISRGEFLLMIFPFLMYFWFYFPSKRRIFLLLFSISFPSLLIFFGFYEYLRLGLDVDFSVSYANILEKVFENETAFPVEFGLPLLHSGERINFTSFLVWIVTLPVPKFIFGDIAGARINAEVSSIILGLDPNQHGFYIVLPGLIAESVYVWGEYLFFMHFVFISLVVALFSAIFSRSRGLFFVYVSFSFLIAYNGNRGGLSSFLPAVVNGLFLLYLILLFRLLRRF